jgi:hypothetical protein
LTFGNLGWRHLVYGLSALLFVAAEFILLTMGDAKAVPLAIGWLVFAGVVIALARLVRSPGWRFAMAFGMTAALVLLSFVGGLLFAPASFVLVVGCAADYLAKRPDPQFKR